MSITAGRAFLAVAGALLIGCIVWFSVAWFGASVDVRSRPPVLVAPTVVGLMAAIAIVVAAPLFSRFVEVTFEGADREGALVIRSVLRPRRSMPLETIDQVVLLKHLDLPSRAPSSSALRVWIRTKDGSVVAFTPRDVDFEYRLHTAGVSVGTERERLTPGRAARKYPGSVGLGERLVEPLMWTAIVVPLIVAGWLIWQALRG